MLPQSETKKSSRKVTNFLSEVQHCKSRNMEFETWESMCHVNLWLLHAMIHQFTWYRVLQNLMAIHIVPTLKNSHQTVHLLTLVWKTQVSYLQYQIPNELIRTWGSREKYDLWIRQDNLSLKNGIYILNLNSVLNLSYECNTTCKQATFFVRTWLQYWHQYYSYSTDTLHLSNVFWHVHRNLR